MSTMLEQAIIDAKSLRESAMQNAENQVIEKYSHEVKEAVKKLLEQEEDTSDDMGGDDDNATTMEQVPMAHLSEDEEDVVVVGEFARGAFKLVITMENVAEVACNSIYEDEFHKHDVYAQKCSHFLAFVLLILNKLVFQNN